MSIHFLAKWRAAQLLNRLRRPAALVVDLGDFMIDVRLTEEFLTVRTPAIYRFVVAAFGFENVGAPEVGRPALVVGGVN
jgi:hypothetical protein